MKDRIEYGGAMIGNDERDAIWNVIESQGGKRWTVGPESVALEKELAEVTGVQKAVLTNSGSSALLVAMAALKLPKGSKVIVPAVNFPTAFNSIVQTGCIPVVVDVELNTLNIDIWKVDKALRAYPDIKAIIVVNIAGNPVNMPILRDIVNGHNPNIKIIVDDCDGYGTTLHGRFIETYADVACISMHAAHIITMGEGGAILTNDEQIGSRAMKMREWGRESGSDKIFEYPGFPDDYRERYVYTEIGYNVKPLELQCAMGRVQLRRLQEFKDARRINYAKMRDVFSNLPHFKMIESIPGSDTCWFSFPLLIQGISRKVVFEAFEKANIECRTIFSGNITKHPAYKDVEYIVSGTLDNADEVMKNGMFLSVHPSITDEMIDFIGSVAAQL